uniref:J domain-containing protein n=1 Tax=Noctiluca scintillans TaxID=2966 RepID=A0A7S1EWP5_NOCSC|mmetsp:Transcript_1411/g.3776  ORF Transcript_1411/g.3776 Transcript_1411/m.3776 type:complete len:266 (+) Transcript_1411:55-852(+)
MAARALNPYAALDLFPGASADEVKRAYRNLSKRYHPDKAAGLNEVEQRECERRMVALNVAYEILSSPRRKTVFDLACEGAPASRRAASCGTPSNGTPASRCPRPPRGRNPPPRPPERGFAPSPPAAEPSPSVASREKPTVGGPAKSVAHSAKPRYLFGAKYTQRSREARRMDPATYTTHHVNSSEAPKESSPVFPEPGREMPVPPRQPAWVQRQMEAAREWEQAHCPEPAEEKYPWRNECSIWLRNMNERKSQRETSDTDVPHTA